MDKVNLILVITNLILWSGLFMPIFFINYDIVDLKRLALGLGAVEIIVVDIGLDLLSYRRKNNGKEILQ